MSENKMIGFEGFFLEPCYAFTHSVSMSRGLYIRLHTFECSKFLFQFKVVMSGRKEHDNNFAFSLVIMLILCLVCINQEG
jgi:hypothetical protein